MSEDPQYHPPSQGDEDLDDLYDPAHPPDYGEYNPESFEYDVAANDFANATAEGAEHPPGDNNLQTYDPNVSEEQEQHQHAFEQTVPQSPVTARLPASTLSPVASHSPTVARQYDPQDPPTSTTVTVSQEDVAPDTSLPPEPQTVSAAPGASALPKSVDLQALLAGLTPARTTAKPPSQSSPPQTREKPSPASALPQDIMYQLSNVTSPPPQQQRQPGQIDIQPQDLVLTPQEEALYDKFLANEREVVHTARWDQFPFGARMFIGNLPSERVSKRDIFRLFYPYGRLAQISIKQAYGFVQFYEREDCEAGIRGQQGMIIVGRKVRMHL
jgi:RNA recognition motif